jgi:Leucine-rich repeat (LRR) protein
MVVCAANGNAEIPDDNLRAGINAYLANRDETSRASDAEITTTELATVTELRLDRNGIADLTGLENCTNIQHLSLNENMIEDISPLS